MDTDDASLTCSLKLEWTNSQGIINRKLQSKNATLRLMRDESRVIYVEIRYDKASPIKLPLKRLSVHKNFMKEGRASIKFQEFGCTAFMTNAPPSQLIGFLRTMFVKMTGNAPKNEKATSLRTQLLSNKPQQFEEISPVTKGELCRVQKHVMGKSTTTPSPIRKRKLSDSSSDSRPSSAKRLYTSSSTIQDTPLDIQQKEVLETCLSGRNVFFTGSAGTGKSYLLRKIIGSLPADVTVATASTGVAACHIGGITLHQFAGIGLGTASINACVDMAMKSASSIIWKKCKHLIIDEVSMIEADYFQKVEYVARKIRKSDKPFGGIQLILCGDFFQLPPVRKWNDKDKKKINFCFMSQAWKKCIQDTFELKKVHRQEEQDFIDILNEVRIGKVSIESEKVLAATASQCIEKDGILATRLCSHTQDADLINEGKLKDLPGDIRIFEALDSNPASSKMLDNQTTVPRRLELKIGAQVMLLKNINVSKGLVNGARGVVKEFKNELPLVKFRNQLYLAQPERWSLKTSTGVVARKQVPLRLAWAFSIHKSQGLTLDCVEMSLNRVFEAGQAYVALSRAQSLKTLRVLDFKTSQVWANPDVINFYSKLRIQRDCSNLVPLGIKNKNTKTNNKNLLKGKSKSLMSKPLLNIL